MAFAVLGNITKSVRVITEPDSVRIQVPSFYSKCSLVVTEYGDTRTLPISQRVAEVLIAYGMSYSK